LSLDQSPADDDHATRAPRRDAGALVRDTLRALLDSALTQRAGFAALQVSHQSELSALRDTVGGLNARIAELERRLAVERTQRDLAEAGWLEAEERLEAAEQRLRELEDSSAGIADDTLEVERPQKGAERDSDLFRRIAQICFPSIVFLRNSLSFVDEHISDHRALLTVLSKLVNDHRQVQSRPVRMAKGWLEARFATGTQADGRLYYRHKNGVAEVLISGKWQQQRDFEWLTLQ
jgi:BMFP domain-containing protein YqiC